MIVSNIPHHYGRSSTKVCIRHVVVVVVVRNDDEGIGTVVRRIMEERNH